MLDDLNELRTFRRIAALGSLTAAARDLGVGLAVVSKRLTTLERRAGVRLIQRSTRSLSITDEGQTLLVQVERALDAIESAEERLATGRDEPMGLLRVGAPVSFGRRHVAPVLGRLAAHLRLADVPDNVWKSNDNFTMVAGKHKPGPGSRGEHDNKNHFADLDVKYEHGKTFLELNFAEPDTYLKPSAWMKYFAAIEPQFEAWAKLLKGTSAGEPKDGSGHWGALPFRVKQLFDTMVAAAKKGDQKLFLIAGGVLIHYIGDACQPLHASYLSQGDPARVVKRPHSDGMKLEADGVHSGYEDNMVAYGFTDENLAAKLKTRIGKLKNEAIADIGNGYDAAQAVIALIHATQAEIAPRAIVNKWVKLNGKPAKDKSAAMWQAFGDDTITCMARGTRYLAKIWQAAWKLGDGDSNIGAGRVAKESELMDLYNNPAIVPSLSLNQYPDDMTADWSGLKLPPPS